MKQRNFLSYFLIGLTCLSFCAANWYYSRGSEFLMDYNLPVILHELAAFVIAGIIPSVIFEVAARMFSLRKRSYGISSGPYNQYSRSGLDALPPEALKALRLAEFKKMATLRIFLIAANLVCFGLSFVYFYNRLLYVWGRVLFNFLVSLAFFIGFLIYQGRKTEKNKIGFLIFQTGRIYMASYCLIVFVELMLLI